MLKSARQENCRAALQYQKIQDQLSNDMRDAKSYTLFTRCDGVWLFVPWHCPEQMHDHDEVHVSSRQTFVEHDDRVRPVFDTL